MLRQEWCKRSSLADMMQLDTQAQQTRGLSQVTLVIRDARERLAFLPDHMDDQQKDSVRALTARINNLETSTALFRGETAYVMLQ